MWYKYTWGPNFPYIQSMVAHWERPHKSGKRSQRTGGYNSTFRSVCSSGECRTLGDGSFHQVWGTICDGVNCYIRKCTIYYHWLWLLINIDVISYWRQRDWFHSNLKNNCDCALVIKDNRWYIYGRNNLHRHKSCPNLVEWPMCRCLVGGRNFFCKYLT